MAEENQALVNQEAINEARALSGEANAVKFDFTPIIEIDNSMIEEKLSSGRKAKVRVAPQFIFTTRNDNNEYIENPYPNPVKGIILKIRYMVDRRGREKGHNYKFPHFRSREFDSFRGQNVVLKSGENISPAYTYQKFKEIYKDEYCLWSVVYFLMDTDEGKKVFKLKMKGVSRSNFWDYMNRFGSDDSITLHETEVSFDIDDSKDTPFNYMCFKTTDTAINVAESLKFGRDLREALDSFQASPATTSEAVPAAEVLPATDQGATQTPSIPTNTSAEGKTDNSKDGAPSALENAMGSELKESKDEEIKVDKIPF